ncbi:MAG: transglycosylase domain-containing protein, partial [Deltaproteobacteria bacterium]|nr:transglycosylase domain-containing protein [Deltaproteobacteria bacterium]
MNPLFPSRENDKGPHRRARGLLGAALILLVLLVLCLAFFSGIMYHLVSRDASERIERGAIDRIIFSESPVYFDDERSVIGVFFEKTHRKYIRYGEIPPMFVKAIVSAEDRNFFSHPGFDPKAILRAMITNLRSGHIVQGGSTITQQTAKNVFRREKRSFYAKLKELFQALLLERRYSKEEILEMYVNQFFVTGFGRGLEIASQYFFDKEAADLDLVECAFIAGSVKSPNRYNPFTKKTSEGRQRAMRKAKERKDYVLSSMLEMKFITEDQFRKGLEMEVPFKEGKVTYRLNVILDYIREQLESGYFQAVLREQGIENIATSGIRIYTSINREIQEGALRSIRTHLPLLDVRLSGYHKEVLEERYRESSGETLTRVGNELPFPARITDIDADRDNPHLVVSWDKGGGIIDYEGMLPIGDAWFKGMKGGWAVFEKRHVPEFLKLFEVGDVVPVRFLEEDGDAAQPRLMLSMTPELEGGVVVLQSGMVRAMVGGFFDRFFNRAVDAKRQLGSIFKPIVYSAALQLKWNILDSLENTPDLYEFEGTSYVPKPDHSPASRRVSMLWAGVKSENLATVWLLYHLTDRLNAAEFREVVRLLGLERGAEEPYEQYVERIRDGFGVLVNRQALLEAAFEEAKRSVEPDLIFSGEEDVLKTVERIHFSPDIDNIELADTGKPGIYLLGFQRLQSLNVEMKQILR